MVQRLRLELVKHRYMKSILESFSPKMKDGNHETWDSQYGLFYKFTLKFKDGETATAQSKNESPKWNSGDEFEVEEKNGFKQAKKVQEDKPFSGGKSYKPDPLQQQYIIAQSSCDKAIRIIELGLFKKPEGESFELKDLESLTDRVMTIINKLANKHLK